MCRCVSEVGVDVLLFIIFLFRLVHDSVCAKHQNLNYFQVLIV